MEKEQKAVFATRLGLLRNSINMSQEQLASALEIDRGTIAKYETQSRIPSYEHLTLFAKYFKVSTDYLLGISDIQSNDTDMQAVCAYTGLSEEAVKELANIVGINSKYAQNFIPFVPYEGHDKIEDLRSIFFRADKDIVSSLLSSVEFWNIALYLKCLRNDTKECSNEFYEKIISIPPNEITKELEEEYNNIRTADMWRYTITREIEKISDMFDKRVQVNKEASDNAKHNPKKE